LSQGGDDDVRKERREVVRAVEGEMAKVDSEVARHWEKLHPEAVKNDNDTVMEDVTQATDESTTTPNEPMVEDVDIDADPDVSASVTSEVETIQSSDDIASLTHPIAEVEEPVSIESSVASVDAPDQDIEITEDPVVEDDKMDEDTVLVDETTPSEARAPQASASADPFPSSSVTTSVPTLAPDAVPGPAVSSSTESQVHGQGAISEPAPHHSAAHVVEKHITVVPAADLGDVHTPEVVVDPPTDEPVRSSAAGNIDRRRYPKIAKLVEEDDDDELVDDDDVEEFVVL